MERYFDKNGLEIDHARWAALHLSGDMMSIAQTHLPQQKLIISTYWTGVDGQGDGPDGKPLIFESVVFKTDDHGEPVKPAIETAQYSTEKSAMRGHKEIVAKWSPQNGNGGSHA